MGLKWHQESRILIWEAKEKSPPAHHAGDREEWLTGFCCRRIGLSTLLSTLAHTLPQVEPRTAWGQWGERSTHACSQLYSSNPDERVGVNNALQ